MPEHIKKSAAQQNLEFQKKEFPARIAAVRKKAQAALAADKAIGKGYKPLSVKERGRHQSALMAAGRVEERLKTGKAPSREAVTKPGKTKAKSTPESRRRKVEKAVGTNKIIDPLRALNELSKKTGARR